MVAKIRIAPSSTFRISFSTNPAWDAPTKAPNTEPIPIADCCYCGVSVYVPYALMFKKAEATVGMETKKLAVPAATMSRLKYI